MHGPPLTRLELAKTLNDERSRLEAQGFGPAMAVKAIIHKHGVSLERLTWLNESLRGDAEEVA